MCSIRVYVYKEHTAVALDGVRILLVVVITEFLILTFVLEIYFS